METRVEKIKRKIRTINEAMLGLRRNIYKCMIANEKEKEEQLWSVMDSLMTRRMRLVDLYLADREDRAKHAVSGDRHAITGATECRE